MRGKGSLSSTLFLLRPEGNHPIQEHHIWYKKKEKKVWALNFSTLRLKYFQWKNIKEERKREKGQETGPCIALSFVDEAERRKQLRIYKVLKDVNFYQKYSTPEWFYAVWWPEFRIPWIWILCSSLLLNSFSFCYSSSACCNCSRLDHRR